MKLVIGTWLLISLSAQTAADELSILRKELEAVRLRLQTAEAAARAETTQELPQRKAKSGRDGEAGPPQILHWSYHRWAFCGEKRLLEMVEGFPASFDGERVQIRKLEGGKVYGSVDRGPGKPQTTLRIDPIECGYKVGWPDPSRGEHEQIFLSNLLRRIRPDSTRLPDGSIRLTWKHTDAELVRSVAVTLDPHRNGLIIVKEIQFHNKSSGARHSAWLERYRVLESVDMGGWHLPTYTRNERLDSKGNLTGRDEVRLTDVRRDIDGSQFTEIFRPGDEVQDDLNRYLVRPDGTFERLASYEEQESSKALNEYTLILAAVAGMGFLAFLASHGVRRQGLRKH